MKILNIQLEKPQTNYRIYRNYRIKSISYDDKDSSPSG